MQVFQNVLKQVSDWAKVCDCEKFIKGQNVIILTRVTGNMLVASRTVVIMGLFQSPWLDMC